MTYGPDLNDLMRRSAGRVDRILKGAKPGDLPIERPNKIDLTVNLKTARALVVSFPRAFLLRADHIVE
jgi:putative ABC transport system substrate-binding protein